MVLSPSCPPVFVPQQKAAPWAVIAQVFENAVATSTQPFPVPVRVTQMRRDAFTESNTASMVVLPNPTAVTIPVDETVATEASELDHCGVRPATGWPLVFTNAAESDAVAPTVSVSRPVVTVTAPLATEGGGAAGPSSPHADNTATEVSNAKTARVDRIRIIRRVGRGK